MHYLARSFTHQTPTLMIPLLSEGTEHRSSRRHFLRASCALFPLSMIGLVGCATANVAHADADGISLNGSTLELDLTMGQAKTIASPGGHLFIEDAKAVVVNEGGILRAFSSVCPHRECDVKGFENAQLVCPCHGSRFDLQGNVLRGPARENLRALTVHQQGNTVLVTLA